ncbi:MAG: DUF4215 domain-containing protein [Bradymonadia bacterium]
MNQRPVSLIQTISLITYLYPLWCGLMLFGCIDDGPATTDLEPCVRMMVSDICGQCGNGEVNAGEECDDGNLDPHDECSNTCTLPVCGDGVMQAGESCDDGNTNDRDSCTTTCTTAVCGDGLLFDGVEACDDGNQINDDGCSNTCHPPGCGDGILQEGEACDDGNDDNTDGCTTECIAVICGDGITQGGETCDDGNQLTEPCPYGEMSCMVCNAECTLVSGSVTFCGDTVINEASGETCDDGNLDLEVCPYGAMSCMVCDTNCQLQLGATSFCGDEIIDETNGETCEPALMQVPPPEPCDFTSRLVSFAAQDDVPPQMENEIFIVDVQGITDEQRTEILARAELLDFDSSFPLHSVSEVRASRADIVDGGNLGPFTQYWSREYMLIATFRDAFFAQGERGRNPFIVHLYPDSSGPIPSSIVIESGQRNIAIAFAELDMFTDSFFASARLSLVAEDGTRYYAQDVNGDDLFLDYNYEFDAECPPPSPYERCIPPDEPNACTVEVVEP